MTTVDPEGEATAGATGQTGRHAATHVPVEVVFDGCHAAPRTVELCVEAARALDPYSETIQRCTVRVTEGAEMGIRVDIRTAGGEVLIDRMVAVANEAQLRAALSDAFVRAAHRLGEARVYRARRGEPAGEEPPSCTWYG